MKYERQSKDIHDEVMEEYYKFLAQKNRADIAYICIMNGLELEGEEDYEQNV